MARRTLREREELQKKLDNYWYHYKWHTLVGVFIAFCMLVYIGDLLTKEKYDLAVVYVAQDYTTMEDDKELERRIEQYTPDFDGNGEVRVRLYNYTVPKDARSDEDMQQQMAMVTRLRIDMSQGENFLYIFDEAMYDYFEMAEGAEDISDIPSDKITDSTKYMLDGTELADGLMIDGRGDFLVMRSMIGLESGSKREKAQVKHDQSREVLENMIRSNKING